MLLEPFRGTPCDFFEGPRLFKEMRGPWHDLQGFLASQLGIGRFVGLDDRVIYFWRSTSAM
jgi:hypothetical protein